MLQCLHCWCCRLHCIWTTGWGMVLSGPSVQELQVQVLEVALVYVYLALLVLVLLLRPVALHLDHVLAVVLFQVQELQVLHQVALV